MAGRSARWVTITNRVVLRATPRLAPKCYTIQHGPSPQYKEDTS